eukprot:GFUD01045044.1.p1 GENE.GFUD01045044.1~~GFUD01045044.1.p1  ORF type:complete len:307 (+),score=72.80 GFUD01045044.1:113-1033(+)
MVKCSKKKIKWRSLHISPQPDIHEDQTKEKPIPEVHPFMKIISKNMDAIIKKDSTPKHDDNKLVFLYRSDKKVGVCDPLDLTQYAGVPIQYTDKNSTVQYKPVENSADFVQPVQAVQNSSTSQYTADGQHQPLYQPYPSHTQPAHITTTTNQHPQPLPTPYSTPQMHYYGQYPSSQQDTYHPPILSPYHHHLPHVHPQYPPHPPHVQYVPYYYYYPVPSNHTQLPTTPPQGHSSVTTEEQSSPAETINTGSTTNSDSCDVQDKVIKRRRKKKKIIRGKGKRNRGQGGAQDGKRRKRKQRKQRKQES